MSRELILLTTLLAALVVPADAIAGGVQVAATNSTAYTAGRVFGAVLVIALVILVIRRLMSGRNRP